MKLSLIIGILTRKFIVVITFICYVNHVKGLGCELNRFCGSLKC